MTDDSEREAETDSSIADRVVLVNATASACTTIIALAGLIEGELALAVFVASWVLVMIEENFWKYYDRKRRTRTPALTDGGD